MAETRRPLIYISYGMPKSGSTLAFEFAKAILETNGCEQNRLSRDAIAREVDVNFVSRLFAPQLETIEREAAALGYPVVLKTHLPPTPDVRRWAAEGRLHGHCVYRDLREIALSMMDHGVRSRAEGQGAFAKIGSLEDALASIRRHVPRYREWSEIPGFAPLSYDDVAFASRAVIRRLCEQLGLDADPATVERLVKTQKFTQFNKGVRGRAREMAPADGERILQEFRGFYEDVVEPRRASAEASHGLLRSFQRLRALLSGARSGSP